jgi:hypothetical protein
LRNSTFISPIGLLIIFSTIGCNEHQPKTEINEADSGITIRDIQLKAHQLDLSNSYDSTFLNEVVERIRLFPEVMYIDSLIKKRSKNAYGVFFTNYDNWMGDSAYYLIEVGDNSDADHYEPIYEYLIFRKTKEILIYDKTRDTIINLNKWRRNHIKQ